MLEQDKWYDFTTFKAALDGLCRSTDSADYFCDPKNKWLREAWIAGEFGRHMRVARIRLAAEGDWPDFDVSFEDGSGLRCEAVEADKPRKRADEYRRAKKLGYPVEHVSEGEMLAELRTQAG
jgi:hypothetical protein